MSHQVCGNLLQQQEKTNTGSTKKRNTQVTLNPKPSGPTHSSVFPNTLRQNPKYSFGYEWDMAQTVHFETTQTLSSLSLLILLFPIRRAAYLLSFHQDRLVYQFGNNKKRGSRSWSLNTSTTDILDQVVLLFWGLFCAL